MGWVDADMLLRQASADEDDFWANRYRDGEPEAPAEAVDAYAATSPTFAARQAASTDRGGNRRLEVQA